MKKLLTLFIVACAFVASLTTAKVVNASVNDTAGLHVRVVTSKGVALPGAYVTYDTATNGANGAWKGTKSCVDNAFVYFYSQAFFGLMTDWPTGSDGYARSGEGANLDGGGISYNGAGNPPGYYGFFCACNPLSFHVLAPEGYTFESVSQGTATAVDAGGRGVWVNVNMSNDFYEVWGYVPGTTVVFRPQMPIGWLDQATCTLENGKPKAIVSGWTCDPSNYALPNDVHMYIDGIGGQGRGVNLGPANDPRDAGVAAACGGYAAHGFSYVFPDGDPVYNEAAHSVYTYGIELPGYPFFDNPLLAGAPKSFTCPRAPYTITINKTEIGDDGADHTWNFDIEKKQSDGSYAKVKDAQISISAADTTGSESVEMDDCSGTCTYRVVEKNWDSRWNSSYSVPGDVTLNNAQKNASVLFENTKEESHEVTVSARKDGETENIPLEIIPQVIDSPDTIIVPNFTPFSFNGAASIDLHLTSPQRIEPMPGWPGFYRGCDSAGSDMWGPYPACGSSGVLEFKGWEQDSVTKLAPEFSDENYDIRVKSIDGAAGKVTALYGPVRKVFEIDLCSSAISGDEKCYLQVGANGHPNIALSSDRLEQNVTFQAIVDHETLGDDLGSKVTWEVKQTGCYVEGNFRNDLTDCDVASESYSGTSSITELPFVDNKDVSFTNSNKVRKFRVEVMVDHEGSPQSAYFEFLVIPAKELSCSMSISPDEILLGMKTKTTSDSWIKYNLYEYGQSVDSTYSYDGSPEWEINWDDGTAVTQDSGYTVPISSHLYKKSKNAAGNAIVPSINFINVPAGFIATSCNANIKIENESDNTGRTMTPNR